MSALLLKERILQLKQLYEELEQNIASFRSPLAFGCKTGCGACCAKPNAVWATVGELLPMAMKIHNDGQFDAFRQQLSQNLSSSTICPIYKASDLATGMGRCSSYTERPLVCRLFGSAARRVQESKLEMLACNWQRQNFPETVRHVECLDETQLESRLPIASDWSWRVKALMEEDVLREEYPIHQALYQALLLVDQSAAYDESIPASGAFLGAYSNALIGIVPAM